MTGDLRQEPLNPFAEPPSECSAITSLDDEKLEQIVAEAELGPLLVTLAQITGDYSMLDHRLRPPLHPTAGEAQPQGGMSPENQETARKLALGALRELKANGGRTVQKLTSAELTELMLFITGEQGEDYLPIMAAELQLDDEFDSPGAMHHQELQAKPGRDFSVAIIGAGMAGLAAAYELTKSGIPYVIFEKNPDVGGTWFENTYPGCRLDTSNFAYSYSFAPSSGWIHQFTPREPIQNYFESVADISGVRPHIRFNSEVSNLTFDEETMEWTLDVLSSDGNQETHRANAVMTAVGMLNRPSIPPIPGRDLFEGSFWHSAEWNHDIDLEGKRVAVVGSGASAFQIVPAIAERTASMAVFQRNPPWMLPAPNYHDEVPWGMRWLLAEMPYFDRWLRFYHFWISVEGRKHFTEVDPTWSSTESVSAANQEMRDVLEEHVRKQVGDEPKLLAKMIPSYPPGSKRMLRDNGVWATALRRDNVSLVTEPIREIVSDGVVTVDGEKYEADIIIYATGFKASDFLIPMTVTGRNGEDLHAQWGDDARAYVGVTVPNFPNLFILGGPNVGLVVNGSAIFMAEASIHYALNCIQQLLQHDYDALDLQWDPLREYYHRLDEANRGKAWGVPSVKSWYKGRSGRVTQIWPHSLLEYWRLTRQANPAHYEFLSRAERGSFAAAETR